MFANQSKVHRNLPEGQLQVRQKTLNSILHEDLFLYFFDIHKASYKYSN